MENPTNFAPRDPDAAQSANDRGSARLAVALLGSREITARLKEEWDVLYEACPQASLCASRAWVESWWSTFGGREFGAGVRTSLLVGVARDDKGRLVGLIPMFEEQGAFFGCAVCAMWASSDARARTT